MILELFGKSWGLLHQRNPTLHLFTAIPASLPENYSVTLTQSSYFRAETPAQFPTLTTASNQNKDWSTLYYP
jgi:hypothetical protein